MVTFRSAEDVWQEFLDLSNSFGENAMAMAYSISNFQQDTAKASMSIDLSISVPETLNKHLNCTPHAITSRF